MFGILDTIILVGDTMKNSYFLFIKTQNSPDVYYLPIRLDSFGGSYIWEIDQFTLTKTKEEILDYGRRLYPNVYIDDNADLYILKVIKENHSYRFKFYACLHACNMDYPWYQNFMNDFYKIALTKQVDTALLTTPEFDHYVSRLIKNITSDRHKNHIIVSDSSIVSPYLKKQFAEYLNDNRRSFLTVEKAIKKNCTNYNVLRGLTLQYISILVPNKFVSFPDNFEQIIDAQYPLETFNKIGNERVQLSTVGSDYDLLKYEDYDETKALDLYNLIQRIPFQSDEINDVYLKSGINGVNSSFDMDILFSLKDYELVKLKKMSIYQYIMKNGFELKNISKREYKL